MTVEVVEPRNVAWRQVLVVVAARDEDGDVVINEFETVLGGLEDFRAQIPRVEQITRQNDGVGIVLQDELQRCRERALHVVLALLQSVLSVAEVKVGEMSKSHV
jgi:hypothetical protein